MKERPILFSAPMVRALLAGTKTQTRRVMARQKKHDFTDYTLFGQQGHDDGPWKAIEHAPDWPDGKEDQCLCPYASHRGDRLWVREAFLIEDDREPAANILYRADGDVHVYSMGEHLRWKPSIHLPRKLSRITLEIFDVRVERLQDISGDDALAEGIVRLRDGGYASDTEGRHYHAASAWHAYASLWEGIHGPGSWALNPWVWVVEFKRAQP